MKEFQDGVEANTAYPEKDSKKTKERIMEDIKISCSANKPVNGYWFARYANVTRITPDMIK